ncbi:MAG TPA: zinc-dependent metalloprotease [Acidimicrobiales bacterium]|nr:zinc-dependent metalloprotease [Acidimicrobiales bacterium]
MAQDGPVGGNPFDGIPLFKDLAGMFQQAGGLNFDVARQTGLWVATGGKSEANVDPVQRIRYEELFSIASLHVGEATGLVIEATGAAVQIATRAEWAATALDAYRPILERLAEAVGKAQPGDAARDLDDDNELAGFLGGLGKMMSPVLIGMQAGVMVGQLAQRGLGPYDLPLPRPAGAPVQIVATNLDEFAAAWNLPVDDLRLWVLVEELAYHVILSTPAVRTRVNELVSAYVGGFNVDASGIEAHLGELDPSDANSLERIFGNPETLLGAIQTDQQRTTLTQLTAAVAAVLGVVDHVMNTVGPRLTGQPHVLTEALRRRRVGKDEDQRFAERMLGLSLGPETRDRGAEFVEGLIERADPDALAQLWTKHNGLPTPAEIDAPGVWLARMEFED